MGADQSTESKRREDERYQRMKCALEQQRKKYEDKCNELMKEQQKTTAATENLHERDKNHIKMIKAALEHQRIQYEEKCRKLLEEQEKIKAASANLTEQNLLRNSSLSTETQANYTSVYPNLQQGVSIETQPSTSSAMYNANSSNIHNQNKSILHPLQDRPLYPQPYKHTNLQPNVNSMSANYSASPNPTINIDRVHNNPHSSTSFDCQPSAPSAPYEPSVSTAPPARTSPTAHAACATSKQKRRPNTSNKKNNDTYQCPTCKQNFLENNIYQCQQGHSSCSWCKINGVNCGICKTPITNTRNIELERIIANVQQKSFKNSEKVNCPNGSDGCSLSFKPENLPAHLKECVFREMECPLASIKYRECFWRGKINQMQAHFLECHPDQTGANVDTEMSIYQFMNNYTLHHIAMGNFNFLIHVKLDSSLQTLFMTVQLIGSLISASKWSYEFHVYDKNEPRRKFTYVDSCTPITVPFSDISKESRCAALPLQYALSFFNNNKLTYKFYIKREESKRGPNRRGYKERSVQSEA